MTDVEKPRFSDDPRGGVYIDDGKSITRVEDAPAAPESSPSTEQVPEVASNG